MAIADFPGGYGNTDDLAGGYSAFPGTLWVNDSGIQLDPEKEASKPPGVLEVTGYQEHFQNNGDHEASRVFLVPWSIRKAFIDWALGWAVNVAVNSDGQVISNPYSYGGGFTRLLQAGEIIQNVTPAAGLLQREIPSQHPEMPWLYAVDCKLEQALSVWTRRNDITVPLTALPGGQVWDDAQYTASSNAPPVSASPEVVAATNTLQALLAQLNLFSNFPLPTAQARSLIDNQLAPDLSPQMRAFYNQVVTAPGLNHVELLAANGNPIAQRYLRDVAALQMQVNAATSALLAARQVAAGATNTSPRRVVDMIRFESPNPSTGGQPFVDGYGQYRVSYRPLPYNVYSDGQLFALPVLPSRELWRYVERLDQSSIKSFQIPEDPNRPLTFVDAAGGRVPGQGQVFYLFLEELTYVWHDVPDVPWEAIKACVNRVNSKVFDETYGRSPHAEQTLLCLKPDVKRKNRGGRGRVVHEIAYKFLKNPKSWDGFPDATGRFRPAVFLAINDNAAPTSTFYERADFHQLFTQPIPVDYQTAGHG